MRLPDAHSIGLRAAVEAARGTLLSLWPPWLSDQTLPKTGQDSVDDSDKASRGLSPATKVLIGAGSGALSNFIHDYIRGVDPWDTAWDVMVGSVTGGAGGGIGVSAGVIGSGIESPVGSFIVSKTGGSARSGYLPAARLQVGRRLVASTERRKPISPRASVLSTNWSTAPVGGSRRSRGSAMACRRAAANRPASSTRNGRS